MFHIFLTAPGLFPAPGAIIISSGGRLPVLRPGTDAFLSAIPGETAKKKTGAFHAPVLVLTAMRIPLQALSPLLYPPQKESNLSFQVGFA
jgi:hypothetical protein